MASTAKTVSVNVPEFNADTHEVIIVPKLGEKQARNVVTLNDGEIAVILDEDMMRHAHTAFLLQTDYENESKFFRLSFAPEAFRSRLAYLANSAVALWEREIAKYLKKNPKKNREQGIADLCEARSYKDIMERAVRGEATKEQL